MQQREFADCGHCAHAITRRAPSTPWWHDRGYNDALAVYRDADCAKGGTQAEPAQPNPDPTPEGDRRPGPDEVCVRIHEGATVDTHGRIAFTASWLEKDRANGGTRVRVRTYNSRLDRFTRAYSSLGDTVTITNPDHPALAGPTST